MNKSCYVLVVLVLLFSGANTQTKFKYRGYSQIKLIKTIVEKNPIISESRGKSLVKSVGYNTLPTGIYFDEDSYIANVPQVDKLKAHNQPHIYIRINVMENSNNPNIYWGSILVCLEMKGNSLFIEYTTKDDSKDLWAPDLATHSIMQKGTILNNWTANKITNFVRNYIQEIFDELNIRIRESP